MAFQQAASESLPTSASSSRSGFPGRSSCASAPPALALPSDTVSAFSDCLHEAPLRTRRCGARGCVVAKRDSCHHACGPDRRWILKWICLRPKLPDRPCPQCLPSRFGAAHLLHYATFSAANITGNWSHAPRPCFEPSQTWRRLRAMRCYRVSGRCIASPLDVDFPANIPSSTGLHLLRTTRSSSTPELPGR